MGRIADLSGIYKCLLKAGLAIVLILLPLQAALAICPTLNPSITHRTSLSYCELCGTGQVTIRFTYPSNNSDPDLTNLVLTEDLRSSGLTYIPNTTNFNVRYGTAPASLEPTVSGANGSELTWDLGAYVLDTGSGGNAQYLEISFEVRRANGLTEEGLSSANRNIIADIDFATTNEPGGFTPCNDNEASALQELPLREPNPQIDKRGRNVDANQNSGQYSNTVYGHNNDDIIWRIRIRNTGLADMQDVRFDDLMQADNLVINYACPSEGNATTIANNNGGGAIPANCVGASNNINNFIVTDPFGDTNTTNWVNGGAVNGFTRNLNGREVDVDAGGTTFIYLVGKITANGSCISGGRNNTVSDFQYGCEADNNGAGGISDGAGDTEILRTYHGDVNNQLTVQRAITGVNTAQPVGSRGYVTITITNNTGGTAKDIFLEDVLPPEYVVDPTYWSGGLTKTLPVRGTPVVGESSIDPRYGTYQGMIDRLEWLNPQGSLVAPSQDPLLDTTPQLRLFSSTTHGNYADQENMLRHGDEVTVTFPIVLISQNRGLVEPYDLAANLDVTPEVNGDGTDPAYTTPLSNTLTVDYDTFCATQGNDGPGHFEFSFNDNNITAFPEDLDIAIGGTVFILTNDITQQLTLPVQVTNNGGHDASDYHVFVTFGATMDVVNAPVGCSVASAPSGTPAVPDEWQPALFKLWQKELAPNPIPIPSTATVYECTSPASIAPGQTVTYDFDVIKTSNAARIAIDDLTFRADVVGEISLDDGSPLWFPTPIARADGLTDLANNYSMDAVWARVVGFNLKKTQLGACSENLPATFDSNGYEEVQIGEECTFHIDTGGWFGFETPGFAYIAVQNIDVVDEVPNGQAYISSTDPYYNAADPTNTSTPLITGISLNPGGLTALTEGQFDWSFNVPDIDRIEVADEWFRVNVTTRLLNKPIDSRAAPNVHAADSFNVLNSTFDATFSNLNTGAVEKYGLGPTTVGYPNEPIRRVDVTVTEPNILVVKEVCNETLYGIGTGCSNFVTLANDGDTQDSYIYRITLTNEASTSGVQRAPAYNLISTDILDASDLVYVLPFTADGLDNDGDGLIDGADGNGEGSISDNVVENGTPPTITYSHTHSDALLQIDPGTAVTFYYRVDPDDTVAPAQQLINSVTTSYDSMYGDSGNQTVVLSANSSLGGARVYSSAAATATVEILALLTQPKTIINLANTAPSGSQPQPVSIGEEMEYELQAGIPVANLRDFYIRDELPAGISCAEAPVVDLDAAPYSDAGFMPGGQFTPTCTDNLVEWDFGDQELTTAPNATARFDFYVRFIARVDNSAVTNNALTISNGVPATNTILHYRNEAGTDVVLNFDQHDILVQEPNVVLTKTYETNSTDAADILTVTVTAENNGTATAYNLRVLDDLVGTNLTYIANITGADPPDSVDTTTFGANQPVFIWNAIAPGTTYTFTFDVSVDSIVQPDEVLDNTIYADWTSLPSQNTALNSSGAIGADGSSTGMRIGTLPPSGDAINDYESSATYSATVPAVTMTKTDLNPAVLPEIGVHKHFQVEIRLPEGVTNGLLVTDSLDFGGQSYLLENNASFDITYTFQDIATINGLAADEAAFTAFPADNTLGSAVWNIGTVVTDTEDDTVGVPALNPVIRIDYYARVNNDINTDVGDTLQNSVDVEYINGETAATVTLNDTTALITVIEPVLSVAKAVTPPGIVSGGDILEYTVTISNSGNATAYDVNVVDTLPSELALYAAFTPTAEIDTVTVGGFIATPAAAPTGPLVWGQGNGDGSLDIPAGSTLVLTYQSIVQAAQANATFNNSVLVDWTSLDGVSTYERTGAGCPIITAPNDYCVGPATTTNSTIDTNTLVKSLVADTYVDAPSNATDGIVRVGDLITYRLELALQEGITRSVQVQDVLPAGLAFYDIVSINYDTDVDYAPPASGAGSNFGYTPLTIASVPTTGQTGALSFVFGDVTNNPLGDATTDTLVIEYRAQVPVDVLPHVASTNLTNTATLSYVDSGGTPVVDPARLESSVTITVWQPIVDPITKIDRSGRTSVFTVNLAADIMNFRIEACNTTGQAPAYSLLFNDVLGNPFNETSISGPVNGLGQPDVYINGALTTTGVDYTYTPPAARGGTISVQLITPVNPGQCVQIDYDIGFYTDLGSSQIWNNSVTLDEYWSLPASAGQQYGPLGPATFTMTNGVVNIDPPTKSVFSPVSGEAVVGEEVVYYVTVPGLVSNVALYDVVINDTLHGSLEYVSASDISGNNFIITDNTVAPGNVSLSIGQIPAGQQAVIELRARVANNSVANAGVNFTNTALYNYATFSGGPTNNGGSATSTAVTIVEPLIALGKTVANITNPLNPPDAGDILRYTVTLTAIGGAVGDSFSDALDIVLNDSLSLGLAYQAGTVTVDGAGNTIADPTVAGDGIATAQTLSWNLADATADIDVSEGTVVTVTYETLVLNNVLAVQNLINNVNAQWTSIDGDNNFERNGTATPAVNDYFATATTSLTSPDLTVTKTRLDDTYGGADTNVRIGDIVQFELRLNLPEGTLSNTVITDTLPQGLIFENIQNINGETTAPYVPVAPFTHNDIAAPTITGNPATGPTDVSWIIGDIVNAGDNNAANNEFVIVYYARVLDNAIAQIASSVLTNTVTVDYLAGSGTLAKIANNNLTLQQPVLTVAKSAVAANGDTVLDVGELVTYTVDITNSGASAAYDTTLVDTIPLGMRNGVATITMLSTTLVNAALVLPNVIPVYDAASGVATWNYDSGVADQYSIAAGETLRIIYQVQADADLGTGLVLTNQAVAQRYYSFDDEDAPSLGGVTGTAEIYGPSNVASVTLTTAAAPALDKQNTALTATVGVPFYYRIIVPSTPLTTDLHDVRIVDDLTASAADLSYVSVNKISGTLPWTPENTGDVKNIVIEDVTDGIDIPAGEQIEIELTVVLDDSATNISSLTFTNTATYTYNRYNNDNATQGNGVADTTAPMTIVGPDNLTLEKSGPAQMRVGTPGTFYLNVHNTGTATAWDMTITDLVPNTPTGGMCDTLPPYNFTAQIYLNDGTTTVGAPLVENTDFTTSLIPGTPTCTLSITMMTPEAALPEDHRLIVSYDVGLDVDTVHNANLVNIAGVTEWYSADTGGIGPTGQIRTYPRNVTDGTPTVLDHEDAYNVVTESPDIQLQKYVVNVTTGEDPGLNASPGDTLRYRIVATNLSPVIVSNFSIIDEVDALNTTPLFVPGSLNIISVPNGADVSATDPNGGANGTGILDVRNLSLDAQGGANESVTIEFEVSLVPVITSGTYVYNQGQLLIANLAPLPTDDPNVNGIDDPMVVGDEDPTQTLIASAPWFQVHKISDDVTGSPAILLPGDTLRYTITVKNIGNENAINSILRDQAPANTTYIANSTTLNGVAVADPAVGVSPLLGGMLINAPENATAGYMRADVDTAVAGNVATITFDVMINLDVINGTLISNQAYLNADGDGSGPIQEQRSDDPNTPIPDDATVDVVGNLPLVDALKTVAIETDGGTLGIVDPDDVLKYTIVVTNYGNVPATGVRLEDMVPANTTFVPGSLYLNDLPVADPDITASPVTIDIAISSADLTPPVPDVGYLSANGTATITFEVVVASDAQPGDIISNQGFVSNNELPVEPTDADGLDANGDQPTLIVVGNVQLLTITKSVSVVGGGPAVAGGQLEYTIRVTNAGTIPAYDVEILDDLDSPIPDQMEYVPGTATLNGLPNGIVYIEPTFTVDYANTYGLLQPGQVAEFRFRAMLDTTLPIGQTVTNIAQVHWNAMTQSETASVSIDIGATPGVANLNGRLWHDVDFDNVYDNSERILQDWAVDIYFKGNLLDTVQTDENGEYHIIGLAPNYINADPYELRYVAPGASPNTAKLGVTNSQFTDGLQRISDIIVYPGNNLQNLDLPIDPNGVVYDSIVRAPVVGATVTMFSASSEQPLPSACFDDPAQQNQITLADGYYKFNLNFSQSECSSGRNYYINVTPPAIGYVSGYSVAIPPQSGVDIDAPVFSVPACLGGATDAVSTTVDYCEVQTSAVLPPLSVSPRTATTNYYMMMTLANGTPGESQPFNNHIPLDPDLGQAVSISKISPKVNVTRAEIVPYTITVNNTMAVPLTDIAIIDNFPAGFKYVKGSARVNDLAAEPVVDGLRLIWDVNTIEVETSYTIKLLLVVGSGVQEGEYVNRAYVFSKLTNTRASGEAQATVRVVPDPTFDCSDIIGKVFDDKNLNGHQDDNEPGLAGVRLATARGLLVTTDAYGRFHVTCAMVPNEQRGSNFILKLDERTLPSGFRVTTENPRVERLTRGKAVNFNFGATVHRVVTLDLADGVFEKDSERMRPQWQPRLQLLLAELRKAPSILRLTYLADVEDEGLVEARLKELKTRLIQYWDQVDSYRLSIETEVYWRNGGPGHGGFE